MRALSEESNLTITLWDESFSTKTAQMTRVAMGVSQKKRRGHLDNVAATIILQSYLEAHRDLEN
jgi:putative Holliday junction resolvase